jgi:SAM-dependent methyltransferase
MILEEQMGLRNITPFRQLSRAYGALLCASDSLATLARCGSELSGSDEVNRSALAQQIAALTAKLDALPFHAASNEQEKPASGAHAYDFNLLLHQARSALMRDMPPNADCLLSAGCSGRWYFDWIEQTYGCVREHLGIEYYSPKPDSLPGNVKWIANTAGNMEAVADKSCDLLISGQNIEHLWPEEIADFLIESARVLKTDGTLCVDSPNRVITALLNWSHPEHTIELTVPEMRHLLELAGFEITKEAGIWLCQDPKTVRTLPLDPNTQDPDWSVTERVFSAADKPEYSFIWWIESRRTDRKPDREAVGKDLSAIYAVAWPERIQRLVVMPGFRSEHRADGEWIIVPPAHDGLVFYGPYMPLRAGSHRITFEFEPDSSATAAFARCEVVIGQEARILDQCEVLPGQTHVIFEVRMQELSFGAQFRCIGLGHTGFAVRRHISLLETLNETSAVADVY